MTCPSVKHQVVLVLLFSLLDAVAAQAATVRFKDSAAVSGEIVTLSDVAHLSDGDPARLDRLKKIELVPTPPPGETLRLPFSQIRSRMQAYGVNLAELEFSGRSVVEVRRAEPRPVPPPTSAQAVEATGGGPVEVLIVEAVRRFVAGQAPDLGEVRVTPIVQPSQAALFRNLLESTLHVNGGQAPFDGVQQLTAHFQDRDGRSHAVLIKADIEPLPWILTAASALPRGHVVQAVDLQWQQTDGPTASIADPQRVVGGETVRPLAAGQPVTSSDVESLPLVSSGDVVMVYSRRPGIVVARQMRSRGEAALGEEIALTSLDGRERMTARVVGLRAAEVVSGGPAARRAEVLRPPMNRPADAGRSPGAELSQAIGK